MSMNVICPKCRLTCFVKKIGVVARWDRSTCKRGDIYSCRKCNFKVLITGTIISVKQYEDRSEAGKSFIEMDKE